MKKDFILNNKIDTSSFVKALSLIEKSRYILIITHVNSDADTISCALALSNYFFENKIKHKVFNVSCKNIPANLNFLSRFDKITDQLPKFYDLVISVDCGSKKRFGFILDENIPLINIDHHKSNDDFGLVNIVDINKASTAEVLYDFFKFNGLYITKQTAIALYVGIYDDSLAFTSLRCDETTYEKINFLVKCGCDPSYTAQNLKQRDSLAKYRIMPKILSSLELYDEGSIASIYCTQEWFEQTGAKAYETEDVLDMIFNMTIVKVVFYLRHQDKNIRVSFRSKEDIDIGKVAESFDGGGHKHSAGCLMNSSDIEQTKQIILKEIFETRK